jgi:hypothetical protein
VSYPGIRRLFNNFQLKVGGLFGMCQAWAKDISPPLDLDIWHNHVHFGFVWESNVGFQMYPALLYDTLKRSNAHWMRLLVIRFCFHFLTFSLNPVRVYLARSDYIILHATWLANCSFNWRQITSIVTSGNRVMNALEINDLFEGESPAGQLYVRLKELGMTVEREWWIDEEGIA